MVFSDEIIKRAWARARGRCECTNAEHCHPDMRCGQLLLWANRSGSEDDAWEAHSKSYSCDQESDSLSKCEILCRDCGCWMCDPKQYNRQGDGDREIERQVDYDRHTYVIVPRESHVPHHLLVVLKAKGGRHRRGLVECTKDDLCYLGKKISKWCSILKQPRFGYDTVYAGCYSDNGHVHFHLIPLNHKRDKGYHGFAMTWLAEKEGKSAANSFSKMSAEKKRERLNKIEEIVKELKNAARDYDQH